MITKGSGNPVARLALGAAVLVLLVVPIATARTAGGSEEPRAQASANVLKQVQKLKKQVKKLQRQLARVSKQPGPAGAKGDTGDPGPSTGPAGGDLTGSYPNPLIAGEAVTTGKLASSIPAARVTHDAPQVIANDTSTLLNFNSERYDTANMHSIVIPTARITAPVAGIYAITAQVGWGINSTGDRLVGVTRNGGGFIAVDQRRASSPDITIQTVTTQARLAAGNFVEVLVSQTSGGNLNVLKSNEHSPEFSMTWLAPGP